MGRIINKKSRIQKDDTRNRDFNQPQEFSYLMGNCSMISDRSYKAPLEFPENEDDADEDASSAISDEVMDDPLETSESSPIDEVDDDDVHFSS